MVKFFGAAMAIIAAVMLFSNASMAQANNETRRDCFDDQKKPGQRIRACSDLLPHAKVDFGRALILYHRGYAYFTNRDYTRAERDYDEAITLNSKDPQLYYARAEAKRWQKRYDDAIADFTAATTLDGEYLEAFYRRGFTYLLKESYPQAIADFEKVMELYIWHAKAMHAMAWIYANANDKNARDGGKAVHWGLRAIDLRPNDAEMMETLAAAYVEKGELDMALKTYEAAMEIGGSFWVRYYQDNLKRKGYNPGPVDGRYGKKTRVAFADCLKKGCRMGLK